MLRLAGLAAAQSDAGASKVWSAEAIDRAATMAPDLTFPVISDAANDLSLPHMAMLKPAGDGPFAAIVLLHQCAGLNPAVLAWARKAIARNYVVLVVDSLGPRGVKSVCYGPQAGVNLFRGVRDALQAAEQLRRQPFVEKDRIALVGFSWGAMVGLLASSSHYAKALKIGPGFTTVASLYPGCFSISPPNGRPPF
jgi:dienelactone hydrolase